METDIDERISEFLENHKNISVKHSLVPVK